MQLAGLVGERPDGDGVLEQAAEVGVMPGARARRAAPVGSQLFVGQQGVEQPPVVRIVDLAREMLEEAVELVAVAECDRQELLRVDRSGGRLGDRAHFDLQLVAEPLDPPGDMDQVAALEAGGHARRHRAKARPWIVPERSRSSRARYGEPVRAIRRSLRTHAKTPATSSPGRIRGDRRVGGRGHGRMMKGASDGAG